MPAHSLRDARTQDKHQRSLGRRRSTLRSHVDPSILSEPVSSNIPRLLLRRQTRRAIRFADKLVYHLPPIQKGAVAISCFVRQRAPTLIVFGNLLPQFFLRFCPPPRIVPSPQMLFVPRVSQLRRDNDCLWCLTRTRFVSFSFLVFFFSLLL